MSNQLQLYLEADDYYLGYLDRNNDFHRIKTDAFVNPETVRIADGYLQFRDEQGNWHFLLDKEGNRAYLVGDRGSILLSYTENHTVEDILNGPNHANIQREIVTMTGARQGDWVIISDGSVLRMEETSLSDTGLKMKGADGKDGVDGITPRIGYNGNWFIGEEDTNVKARGETPHLFEHDGSIQVTYDPNYQSVPYEDLECQTLFEYVPKSEVTELQTAVSDLQTDVTSLSDRVDDICDMFDQGGDDWTEESMPYINPEALSWSQEFNDVPHYVIWHDHQLKSIGYESGELPEGESYPLYGEHEGYGDPAYITYNLYGDYCTVSVSNLLLINGQADIYFRLPVEPVEETNTTFMAREGSNYQLVCCTVGHHDYSYTGITEPVLWFRPCEADTYNTDYHISLTITYKYRNNEDF